MKLAATVLMIYAPVLLATTAAGRELNGFDLSNAAIPPAEILRGGPARDGIPALDHPPAIAAVGAPWKDADWVVGVESKGVARAYPLRILVWHELVNDSLGSQPIVVTYCPLCGSALVFDRRPAPDSARPADAGTGERRMLRFAVSGLLYQSDLLMFDRETDSLWTQIGSEAVTGAMKGQRLALVPSRLEPWGQWRARHPETTVLSTNTGHSRNYDRAPYAGYSSSRKLYFPAPRDPRYHPKMRTIGLRTQDGAARAYPIAEIERAGNQIEDRFEGGRVAVRLDLSSQAFDVEAPDNVEVLETYWFAWMAFHPDSTVYRFEP